MDNWDDLRFLVAVSKTGTMTGAARLLGTNVATVSRRVERLTQQLGQPPFVKTAEGWKPSAAAAGLIEVASAFEGRISREINQNGAQGARGPIRIGCPPFISSHVLFPALAHSADRLASVQLEFTDRVFQEGLGDNDVVIRPKPPTGGRLRTRRVGEMAVRLYRHEREGEEWAGLDRSYDETSVNGLGLTRYGRPPLMRVPTFRALADLLVQSGLPGPLPDLLAQDHPMLEPVPEVPPFQIELWVIYHESRRGDPAIEAVLDWIDAAFAQLAPPHHAK
ncbi:LysR family transcriptional regulator [Limimaricola pyoseonensis]|uniref:DNA-binding transcriptional regulator, LysR family n=1 Tax=Limimaricola pyoseonensis TaxID=521013 RepID=A0A1G7A7A8_9RHOB|nr:LysR family transcriptional regulator [Limimaricola pyoseonensis]SDE10709.1 DNA-binding transcriptional regulator, LysR family [Limimaricola pyoseonensis]